MPELTHLPERRRVAATRAAGRRATGAALLLALVLGAADSAAAKDPTASILVTPAAPVAGETVTFTAEASADDAAITSYAWDLDGDAQLDDGQTPQVSRVYDAPGTYTVSLRVRDDDDDEFLVYTSVDVTEAAPAEPPPAPPVPPVGPEPPRLLDPFPVVRVAGQIVGTGVRLQLVTVRAPRGTRVVVSCRGRGCPQRRLVRRVATRRRLARLEGHYRHGARLTFRLTAPGRIGKYTRIVVRRGLPPARTDRCLWPGDPRPQACPP